MFTDAATAKETWTTNPNATWLWSYGLSARSNLAGYPIRVDVAWPGTFNQQPVWYFSLSLK
jgi:outer membrane protein assembly factor BamA